MKKMKNYESHKDLNEFEEKYNEKIDKFLDDESRENNTVFLNADYGWGKTTFVENNLKVEKNNIYSPWLNSSNDYLEEIYYTVSKKSRSKINSVYLFIILIFSFFSIISSSFITLLIEINNGNITECRLDDFKIICSNGDNLNSLLIYLSIFIIILLIIVFVVIFVFKPVVLLNLFNKGKNKYYDIELMSKISKKIDTALVIEDIDRCNDVEDILITVDKLSRYLKDNNTKKYILLTGEYSRTIDRINKFSDNIYGANSDGNSILERVVSLRVDFLSIETRIENIIDEENMKLSLTKIEKDELINFIKSRFLSVRFFIKFIQDRKQLINNNESVFHQLLDYYKTEKLFNINTDLTGSMFDNNIFPKSLNDLELLLQKGEVKINNIIYTRDNIDYSKLDLYTSRVFELLKKNSKIKDNIKFYYKNDYTPILNGDYENRTREIITVGKSYPDKDNLDRYLLGFDITGNDPYSGKRCYFKEINGDKTYKIYKINFVQDGYYNILGIEDFISAYIGAFFNKNKSELINNYPCIYKLLRS